MNSLPSDLELDVYHEQAGSYLHAEWHSAGSQPLNPPGIFCEASLADEGIEPSCPQPKYELTVKWKKKPL